MKGKKGQGFVTGRVIGYALLAIGVVILLGIFASVYSGTLSEDEACRLSVLARATAPESFKSSIGLSCKTKKICLTGGLFGECKQFSTVDDVVRVRLSGSDQQKADKIAAVSASEMLGCWNLMGEGKLDLFGKFAGDLGLRDTETTCVVCSRVAVADDISNGVLQLVDVNKYMQLTRVPGSSETYLQSFTDKSVLGLPKSSDNALANEVGKITSDRIIGEDLDGREMALLFMQIKSPEFGEVFDNLAEYGGAVAGGTFVVAAIGVIFSPVILIGTVAAVGTGAYAYHTIYEGRVAAAGVCRDFTSNEAEAQKGCSLVQMVPWSAKDVNKLCPPKNIQGIP